MADCKESLKGLYDQIWNSSKKYLLDNCVEIDKNLSDLPNDRRLGLSVLMPIGGGCLDNFMQINEQLKNIEPEQYFYPKTDIHVTLIDLISASQDFVFEQNQAEIYKKMLNNMLKDFPSFSIKFCGLTASKGAVMAQGFFGGALQKLREQIREEVKIHGIELKERYKVATAHSTIMRFGKKLQNPEALANKIEELRNIDLGVFEARKIIFVLHDWYNSKEKTKILAEYELQ